MVRNVWVQSLKPKKVRKNFKISTQKMEWMSAAGKDPLKWRTNLVKTSKCRHRHCKKRLVWKDGTYNFDHKDNNPSNNSQRNCYLVCRNCHGRHTKIGKRKKYTLGVHTGYETVKKKVGYKKPKKKKTVKKKTKKKPKDYFRIKPFKLPKIGF